LGEAVPGVARRAKTGWRVSSDKLFLSAPMGLRVALTFKQISRIS